MRHSGKRYAANLEKKTLYNIRFVFLTVTKNGERERERERAQRFVFRIPKLFYQFCRVRENTFGRKSRPLLCRETVIL